MKSHRRNFITFLFVLINITCINTQLFSQQVRPSDRVTNYVNVREEANTQSEIVGRLNKSESAIFIEEVPYWYKIKLNNEQVGYVSKAWTDLTDTPPPSPSGKTDLIIGSWNIKWFGSSPTDKHNYDEMAKIIQKMDVIAIQELKGNYYKRRLDSLIAHLSRNGYKYDYRFSDETGYKNNLDSQKGNYTERLCFLWDTDRIEILESIKFVNEPAINNSTFRQVPIIADFKVTDGNGFDFRIMAVHTVYNKKINYVRRDEIQYINDWMIQQSTSSTNSEKNIIAIGDFNANPHKQPQAHYFAEIISGTSDYRVLFEEPQLIGEPTLRTTIQQSSNPGPNYFLLPVYDQALISNETSYALPHSPMTRAAGDLGVVEFDQEEYWKSFNDWDYVIGAMSDHRPIWFRLDYDAEDND